MYKHTVYYKEANMIVSIASIIDPYLFTLLSFYRSLAAMQNHNIEVRVFVCVNKRSDCEENTTQFHW
jgi:hypothetical protein